MNKHIVISSNTFITHQQQQVKYFNKNDNNNQIYSNKRFTQLNVNVHLNLAAKNNERINNTNEFFCDFFIKLMKTYVWGNVKMFLKEIKISYLCICFII